MNLLYFFDIIKRAKSYKGNMICFRGLLINTYNSNDDNDESGHHHIIEPNIHDEIYEKPIIFNPDEVYKALNELINKCEEIRKTKKLKPKDLVYQTSLSNNGDCYILTVTGVIGDSNEVKQLLSLQKYTDETPEVKRFLDIVNFRADNVPDDSHAFVEEINKEELLAIFEDNPRIQYLNIKVGDVDVKVPLIKSFLFGLRKFDKMKLEVMNTKSKDLYLYVLHVENNNIIEKHISYINNF